MDPQEPESLQMMMHHLSCIHFFYIVLSASLDLYFDPAREIEKESLNNGKLLL